MTIELASDLAKVQAEMASQMERQIQASKVENTPEWELLQEINTGIDTYNASLPPRQRKGRKRAVTAERLFKIEKISRDRKKGGLDSVFYAFQIYRDQLFKYYQEVQALHPHKEVFIVEDNVGVHHKARRIVAGLIKAQNIKFLDTPANSPDLQPIETLHSDEKRLLRPFAMGVVGSGKDIQELAEDEVSYVWKQNPEFGDCVARKASISYFQGLCYKSKQADPPYSNRFKDSM